MQSEIFEFSQVGVKVEVFVTIGDRFCFYYDDMIIGQI